MDDSLKHIQDEIFIGFRIPSKVKDAVDRYREEKKCSNPENSNFKNKKGTYVYLIGLGLRSEGVDFNDGE